MLGRLNPLSVALALALLASPATAQPAGKVYRLGYLSIASEADDTRIVPLRQSLRELGYVDGRNVAFEIRYAEGKSERLPEMAADLVRRKVDLIVTTTGIVTIVARKATPTIPIVMVSSGDAVRQGLVESLARPGGNVTGLTMISPELSRKRLELLREMLPHLSHVGVLWCGAGNPVTDEEWAQTQAAADLLKVRLSSLEAKGRDDLAGAFAAAKRLQVQAILGFDCPLLAPSAALLAELSIRHRLPAMQPFPLFPRAGSLMSYGAISGDAPRHAATYVDRILKGAKPADLPVQQPTKFELVLNARTAKALGISIPQSVIVRADEVIE